MRASIFSQDYFSALYILCRKILNAVSARMSIFEKFPPVEILLGWKLDAKRDFRVRFGVHFKASHDSIITNDITNRTHPCISLGPSGNMQGSLKWFDLLTSKVIICCTFKEFFVHMQVYQSGK